MYACLALHVICELKQRYISAPFDFIELCHTKMTNLSKLCSLKIRASQSIEFTMRIKFPGNRKLFIILSFVVNLGFTGLCIASDLPEEMKTCANEQSNSKRLSCYDALAQKHKLVNTLNFVVPSEEFLSSKLTVTPWRSEYKLTIQQFVNLIKSAVMEDGKKIAVHGWTRQGHDYVLNITMREPLRLRFLPFETATPEIPLSLFRKLVIDGETTDPELFVTTIASMVPDKK